MTGNSFNKPAGTRRIIHTSDWHLGLTLHNCDCSEMQKKFLLWLSAAVDELDADCLLVTGDIFNTRYPTAAIEKPYYDFLGRLQGSRCREVYIMAGNHDSHRHLTMTDAVLNDRNIHVIGLVPPEPESFHRLLRDAEGNAWAALVPLPYLRVDNIQQALKDDETRNSDANLAEAFRNYTAAAVAAAKSHGLPVILTAHQTIGSPDAAAVTGDLRNLDTALIPAEADYVALGHIHRAGFVGTGSRIRYCGSPYPTSVDDESPKSLTIVDIAPEGGISIQEYPVPVFLPMKQLDGTPDEILRQLPEACAGAEKPLLLSVVYHAPVRQADFFTRLKEECAKYPSVTLLGCQFQSTLSPDDAPAAAAEALADFSAIDPKKIFTDYLHRCKIAEEEQNQLLELFCESLQQAQESLEQIQSASNARLVDTIVNPD